jgi:hypothetical protein
MNKNIKVNQIPPPTFLSRGLVVGNTVISLYGHNLVSTVVIDITILPYELID